ncbi:MAG: hypothetical protein O2887_13580 [Bacteroidetes bacterium]|nr:hypothetical protein [Bacteroidota bacterium]
MSSQCGRNFKNEFIGFIKSCYSGEISESDNVFSLIDPGLQFEMVNIPKSIKEEIALQSTRKIGIPIWEDQWLTKNNIIKSRILSLVGKSKRIYGRETHAVRLNKTEANEFLGDNHLMGATSSKSKLGLLHKEKLVAVATFSKSTPITRDGTLYQSFEMIRYCAKNAFSVVGGLSKLINHFIETSHPDDIMTYIDLEWSKGRSFEQLGFRHMGVTPPQHFWINPIEMIRYYPHRLPDGLLNIPDELHNHNYFRISNSGNSKFIKLLK